MNVFSQLKRSLAIAQKDLSIYYFRGPVIIQGLLIPAFLFLSFSVRREVPLRSLMPGLLGMALFFTVSAITPVIAPWETRMRTFERLVSSPIALWAIIFGDVLASVVFGVCITFFIILAGVLLLGVEIISFSLIIGTVMAAFSFSTLGVLISAPPKDKPSDIMLFATLIKFSLLFISGVFVPIAELGRFRVLSFFSPLTYYVDLARRSVQGTSEFSFLLSLSVLTGFTLLLFFFSCLWHKKSLDKRF